MDIINSQNLLPKQEPEPIKTSAPLLGVIGGMGTQATACFYEKLHALQSVTKEQDYLDVLVFSMPSIPDRTAFITGKSDDNPLNHLIRAAKTLENAGSSCIALPCATSHYFYDDIKNSVNIPILHLLDETAKYVYNQNIKKVCLLATTGTIQGKAFHSAFGKYNIEVTTPQQNIQSEIMDIIYNIKKGTDVSPQVLNQIIDISLNNTESVILGCTELCVINNENSKIVNILDVLAKASVKSLLQFR